MIVIMMTAVLPVAIASASSVPQFHLVDNFNDGNLQPMAPPPGKGHGGGGSTAPQEVDWGVARIGALAASSGVSRSGVTVAVLDTGVDYSHADLAGVVVSCFSAIKRADYACDNKAVSDSEGHGTHVAGTIAALDNSQGTVGVFSGVSIVNGKVLSRRGGDWNDLSWGIHHATDMGVDVISMSLGGDLSSSPSTQQIVDDAVAYAVNHGVAVVVAAGNEGTCTAGDVQHSWPAESPGAFTIGATGITEAGSFVTTWDGTQNDVMPCFSNDMPAGVVDISAPGVYITSLKAGGGVTDMSGTSMATPHVSGAIALLMAQGYSASQAQNILVNNALDMGYSSTLQGAGLMLL